MTTNVYDDEHRVISQQDAQQHETTWDYSTPGKTVVTDPSGAVTSGDLRTRAAGLDHQRTRHAFAGNHLL